MRRQRVLITDNDSVVRRFVRANLEARGFTTFIAGDGIDALRLMENETPDLLIMDAGLDNPDGIAVCRRIRENSEAPIILLSTRSEESFRVKCFEAGADDFLTKPFGVNELIARVRALLRRSDAPVPAPKQALFSRGNLTIKFAERRVTVADREVQLTPTEYSILQELAVNADKVLTHNMLLNKVWGPQYRQEREYLRVFVGRLRKKLEPDARNPNYIVTVPWVGYKLEAGNFS